MKYTETSLLIEALLITCFKATNRNSIVNKIQLKFVYSFRFEQFQQNLFMKRKKNSSYEQLSAFTHIELLILKLCPDKLCSACGIACVFS